MVPLRMRILKIGKNKYSAIKIDEQEGNQQYSQCLNIFFCNEAISKELLSKHNLPGEKRRCMEKNGNQKNKNEIFAPIHESGCSGCNQSSI